MVNSYAAGSKEFRASRRMQIPSFWNCGPSSSSSETEVYNNGDRSAAYALTAEARQPPPPGTTTAVPPRTMRSFVDGIITPFVNCVQPPIQSCVAPAGTKSWKPSAVVDDAALSSRNYSYISPQIHKNDVLCGRGGSSIRHEGNQNFRKLIAANRTAYCGLTKKQKMMMARQIVDMIHSTSPPGRFLARDPKLGLWYDIGLPRSLEKTSQALREKPSEKNSVSKDASKATTAEDSASLNTPVSMPSNEALQKGQSPEERKTPKSSRNVKAPPIVVPPDLERVFQKPRRRLEWPPPDSQPPRPPPASYSESPPAVLEPNPYAQHYGGGGQFPPPKVLAAAAAEPAVMNPPGATTARAMTTPTTLTPHRTQSLPGVVTPVPSSRFQATREATPSGSMPVPAATTAHSHSRHSDSQQPIIQRLSFDPRPAAAAADGLAVRSSSRPASSSRSSPGQTSEHGGGLVNNVSREMTNISPERQQEWKRQRTTTTSTRSLCSTTTSEATATTTTTAGSTCLSQAIESHLSLEERVIGKERLLQDHHPLHSPSRVLQSRSRRSFDDKRSSMDGLAALSTAAFLRLDESD